jgi:hypothetical protein
VSTSRDRGNLLGGWWGQWALGGSCPRWPVVHRKGKAGGGGNQRSGVWETVEGPGERVAGAFVVLMRVKDKALGFCSELSVAAAR